MKGKNNEYEKNMDDLSTKIDLVEEKIKIKNNKQIFTTTKIENNKGNVEIFKCQNDIENIKEKINNILEESDVKKLIENALNKEEILRNCVQEEINKKINILMDFKKKVKMIF